MSLQKTAEFIIFIFLASIPILSGCIIRMLLIISIFTPFSYTIILKHTIFHKPKNRTALCLFSITFFELKLAYQLAFNMPVNLHTTHGFTFYPDISFISSILIIGNRFFKNCLSSFVNSLPSQISVNLYDLYSGKLSLSQSE